MMILTVSSLLWVAAIALAHTNLPGVIEPIVEECGFDRTVVCVNKYVRPINDLCVTDGMIC